MNDPNPELTDFEGLVPQAVWCVGFALALASAKKRVEGLRLTMATVDHDLSTEALPFVCTLWVRRFQGL